MKLFIALLIAAALPVAAAELRKSTGERTTPPTVGNVNPRGLPIGKTSELTVDGLNLTKTTAIYFDKAGITATVKSIRQLPDLSDIRLGSAGLVSTVDLGPLPPRMEVTFDVSIPATVEPGPVAFRLYTPFGTTPMGRFVAEPADPEVMKTGSDIAVPSILAGVISKPGKMDTYKVHVKTGEELTFENPAMQVGSTLQPVISILQEDGKTEAEYGNEGGPAVNGFRHKFVTAGVYTIRIGDFLQSGGEKHFYRVRVSHDELRPMKNPMADEERTDAKYVTGIIDKAGGSRNHTFTAKKGDPLIIEIRARRDNSELDSLIEVLDAKGKPVEIGVARAVLETNTTLTDRGSNDRNVRLVSITGVNVGDYLLIGTEIVRIKDMPRGPDEDVVLDGLGAERASYFGTSAEAHYMDSGVYKLQIHPAGTRFSPNGLPLVKLLARNDDGEGLYGKDSYLRFTAPEDGEYTVRVKDTRGMGGPKFTYKLSIRKPQPDFRLTVTPANPNVPIGGTIPVAVTAFRMDGLDGPIDVELKDLPPGLTAVRSQIPAGQDSTTVLLSAAPDAKLDGPRPFRVTASGAGVTREAAAKDLLRLVSLAGKPDVLVTAQTKVVELEPGQTAEVSVSIERQNGFGGRVPVDVRNLPTAVRIPDFGLNGVLINEDESKRTFHIEALDVAQPTEQMIYLAGKVETRSESPLYAAPQSILLRVKPKKQ